MDAYETFVVTLNYPDNSDIIAAFPNVADAIIYCSGIIDATIVYRCTPAGAEAIQSFPEKQVLLR